MAVPNVRHAWKQGEAAFPAAMRPDAEGMGASKGRAEGARGPGHQARQDTENPPIPVAWVEAMRNIGYTPPAAIAELVDNCVNAGARNITIRVSLPRSPAAGGFVAVADDGRGMEPEELVEAMRWGGAGQGQRRPDDLGRFGLGMKTASFSMGRRLTVASRGAPGQALKVLRWDLDHIAQAGWRMLDTPDAEAAEFLARSPLANAGESTGTMVIVTQLDRLAPWASAAADEERSGVALEEKISRHLGMVFHRFIAEGLVIRLGSSVIPAWDPFDGAVQKETGALKGSVRVASYVLPHHSRVSGEQNERMAGPLGWGAHQGFFVYRAKRLIVPGGWLGLFTADDSCRLSRIRIDLPNALDEGWNLDVLKSRVAPPQGQLADLRRIGEAARRQAVEEYNLRGDAQAPSQGPRRTANPLLKERAYVFFGAVALLVYLRLMYRAAYFPPYFEGEEANALDLAKATCEFAVYTGSWLQCVIGGFFEYNKGYHWALVPLYQIFGYDVRLITFVLPVFFSVLCAAFCTIYRRVYPRSSLLSFLLVAVFSVLCVCLRRYKWHSVAYLSAISVYLYFSPHFYNGAPILNSRRLKVLSLSLFALSCYCYFGCLVYAVPFLLLAFYFSTKAQRRMELKYAWIGVLAFLAVFLATYKITDLWGVRIRETLDHFLKTFTHEGLREKWWTVRDYFFTMYLSVPYLVLFVVGLAASFKKIRSGDRFALVNMTLLLCLGAFHLAADGLNNADQLNWSMIPVLGVLLIGSDQILSAIRGRFRGGSIIGAALVLLVAWSEIRWYLPLNRDVPYQPYVQPRNVRTQAALVLMMIRDDDSGSVQYYLPDPSVADPDGGFDYNVSLKRVDFAKALSRVVFFKSEEDFQKKFSAQPPGKPAVVYLSVGEPQDTNNKDNAEAPFLGQKPMIIHPFEDVYKIQFVVREYRLHPGPANAQAPGGPT